MTPPASRANSIMVRASPTGPPAPRVSRLRGMPSNARGPGHGDEVEQPVVHHPEPPAVAEPLREAAEPGMVVGLGREEVVEDADALAALLQAAQHGARGRPPSGTSRRSCGTRRAGPRPGAAWMASKSANSGASHDGSSLMPCAPGVTRRWGAGRGGPGPPVPRYTPNRPSGLSGTPPPRRTSKEIARTRRPVPSRAGIRSHAASMTAWTSESWPRLGQPWFMSRIATSTMRSSRAGRSAGASTRL